MTKLDELRKLAEAAISGDSEKYRDFMLEANPKTILAMCDLMQQMRDALSMRADMPHKADYYEFEALAAFDKFNGGK